MTANLYIFGPLLALVGVMTFCEVLHLVLTVYQRTPPRERPDPFSRVRMAATIVRRWCRTAR